MYFVEDNSQLADGMGFSLKPPKVIRDAVSSLFKSAKVTVPTPAGPVVVTDPATIDAAKNAARGATVTFGPSPATPMEQVSNTVTSSVPGGWITVGAVAVGGALLLRALMKRRRGARR